MIRTLSKYQITIKRIALSAHRLVGDFYDEPERRQNFLGRPEHRTREMLLKAAKHMADCFKLEGFDESKAKVALYDDSGMSIDILGKIMDEAKSSPSAAQGKAPVNLANLVLIDAYIAAHEAKVKVKSQRTSCADELNAAVTWVITVAVLCDAREGDKERMAASSTVLDPKFKDLFGNDTHSDLVTQLYYGRFEGRCRLLCMYSPLCSTYDNCLLSKFTL